MADRLPSAITARFQVRGAYASGSTGTLYRATDTSTGREGLLKVVTAAAQITPSERGRLVRELEKLVTLHHPSLATILAAGSAEDLPWLFRELIEGESLETRIARGPVPASEALGIAAQIASGLDELHRAGLLQRDLSPSHIVLRQGTPQAVLIDSGIAGRIPTSALFEVSGKPEYVSPEHAQGKLVSFRSDLYSLGAVLFEAVTGTPVYQGTADQVLEAQRSQPPPQVPAGLVPPNIASLLGQLLAKEPRERPFSAQQVRRALEPFLPSGLPHAPPAGAAAKKTLLGVPSPVGRPRADQTEELSSLDIVRAEAVLRGQPPPPPRAPEPPRADATMPLTAMDLSRAEAVLKGPPKAPAPIAPRTDGTRTDGTMPLFGKDVPPAVSRSQAPPPPPPSKAASLPPPPPPGATAVAAPPPAKLPTAPPPPPAAARAPSQRPPGPNSTLVGMALSPAAPVAPVAPAAVAPAAAPPVAAPAAAPSVGDLDYDDLAETRARDVDSVVSPFAVTIDASPAQLIAASQAAAGAPSPFSAGAAPSTGFGPPTGGASSAAPSSAPSSGFGPPSSGFGGASGSAPSSGFGPPSSGFGGASGSAPSSGFGPPSSGFGGASGSAPSSGFGPPSGFGGASGSAPSSGFGPPSTASTVPMQQASPVATQPSAPTAAPYTPPASDEAVPMRRVPVAVWVALGIVSFCLVASLSGGAVAYYLSSSAIATLTPVTAPPAIVPIVPAVNTPGANGPANAPPLVVPPPVAPPAVPPPVVTPPPVAPPTPPPVVPPTPPPATPPPATPPPATPPPATPPPATPPPVVTPPPSTPPASSGSRPSSGGSSPSSSSGGSRTGTSGRTPEARASGGTAPAGGTAPSGGAAPSGRIASRIGGGGSSATPSTPATPPASGGDFEATRARALDAFRARRFPEAEREYLAATRLNPRHAGVWSGLGAARLAQHNARGAVEAYERAVAITPSSANFHASLGRALAESGDRARARREYEEALRLDPDNRDARTGLERL